ncbi:MAG: VOC family protein [Gemmatimonadota bacterium]
MNSRHRYGIVVLACVLSSAPLSAQLEPPNEAGVTYGHIHLYVADTDAHVRLWSDLFEGIATASGPTAAVWLPGTLMMFNQRDAAEGSQGSVVDHIGFKVRDYDAFVARWREAGLPVEREFEGGEGVRNAYLSAPDGVRVEIQEDRTLRSWAAAYHLHWYAPDAPSLRDFYVRWFGATARPRGPIENTADVPGMNLSFNAVLTERPGTRGRAVDHIGFEVVGLEALVEEMEAAGIVFDIPYRVIEGLGIGLAFFTDPSGAFVELTEGLGSYR